MHRRAKRDKRDQDRPSAPALLASTRGQLAHIQTKDLKNKNKKESTSKTTNRRQANVAGVELAMQQRISELEIKVFELQQQKDSAEALCSMLKEKLSDAIKHQRDPLHEVR